MTDFYRFPAMAKLYEFNDLQQVEYIQGEAKEAMDALCSILKGSFNKKFRDRKRKAYGMELMDVIHATETALRMEFTEKEVEELQRRVIEKNRKRGYYDD